MLRIKVQTLYANNVTRVCTIDACTSSVAAKGMCDKHYRRWKKHGNTNTSQEFTKICPECLKSFSTNSKGAHQKYCSKECVQAAWLERQSECKINECKNKSKNKSTGLCAMHYRRLKAHGDPLATIKLAKYPEGTACGVESCKGKVIASGFCSKHWQMWKKHGDPLGGRYVYKIRKAITHDDGTRTCSECNLRLPITDFHKDKNATDGYRSKCKKCRITKVKKWYLENQKRQSGREKARRRSNPEKYAEKEALRYEKDREKRIALATEHSHLRKARKKKAKTERGITKLALRRKFGSKCYYCGIEMDFSVGSGRKFNRKMATIEHLVPLARGGEHTWENTVLACRHCNISKNAKTEEEFKDFNS